MLPIVQRELQTAARNPKLYRGRFLGWIAVLIIVAAVVPFHGRSRGGEVFQFLTNLTLFLCLLEGIRKTADSISSERREGTLGLLFLSTLSGWDIILGKLASAAIRSLSTLLIFVPVLAVTLLLGGTTGGEFWRAILVLVLALFMSLSVCLCLSTLSREAAISASFGCLLVLSAAPTISVFANRFSPWALPLSPFWTLQYASDSSYGMDNAPYWRGVIYITVLILLALSISSFVLPRLWRDKPIKARATRPVVGKVSQRLLEQRRAMLDRNPIMWLMFNPRSHHHFRLLLLGLVAFVMIGSGSALFFANYFGMRLMNGLEWFFPTFALAALALITSLRVARDTSRNFSEARANGALELMLSTPLKVRDIISGQWQALRVDLFPALIVFVILGVLILLWSLAISEGEPTLVALKLMVETLVGIPTIATVGIWMGLTSKGTGRAFFKTVMIAFIAPHAVLCIPTLVLQVVILLVALDKVQVHFRRFVAEQYLAHRTFLSSVAPARPNTPPVLRH